MGVTRTLVKLSIREDSVHPDEVLGEVYGRFAVTPWIPDSLDVIRRGRWTVTHVASGNAVTSLWGHGSLTLAVARKVACWLHKHSTFPDEAGFGEASRIATKQWALDNPKAADNLRAGVREITRCRP